MTLVSDLVCPRSLRAVLVSACLSWPLGAQAVHDSAGIRIVEVDGSALNRRASLRIATEPSLLLGQGDNEMEEFNQVIDVVQLASGNVVVVNRGTNELRFFDPQGRYLHSSGRTGRGPGEYLSISAVALLPSDTILVQDWSTSRINVIDSSGKYVRSFRLEPASGRLRAAIVGVFTDGTLLGTSSDYPQDADLPPGQYTLWQTAFSFKAAGEPLKELSKLRERELVYFEAGREFNGSIRLMQPLGLLGTVRVQGDRYFTGDGATFEIREYESDGRLLRILRVGLARRPVSAADRAAEKERFAVAYKGTLLSSRLDELWPRAPMPDYLPAFQTFEVDVSGRLWVKASKANLTTLGPGLRRGRGISCKPSTSRTSEAQASEVRDPVSVVFSESGNRSPPKWSFAHELQLHICAALCPVHRCA